MALITINYVTEYGDSPNNNYSLDGTILNLPTLEVDGYEFLGWYSTETFEDGTKVEVGDTITSNITLYAKWRAIVVSVNSKMTAIADEVRELSGTTGTMGLDDMASNLNEANRDINIQSDLITQITEALNGKASGGEVIEQATPVISINSNGLITATAGDKSATKQLTTQEAKTIAPSTSSQTAVAKDVYTTGVVTVGAIPSDYVIPSGTLNITTNGTYNVKNYESATVNIEGSGGGNIETNYQTCTVTFDNESISNDCEVKAIVATVLEDGAFKTYTFHKRYSEVGNYLMTLSNVVCGTKIYLTSNIYMSIPWVEIDGSAIYESAFDLDAYNNMLLTFTAPSVANEICTIYYSYDV